jgi:hypothetical protein
MQNTNTGRQLSTTRFICKCISEGTYFGGRLIERSKGGKKYESIFIYGDGNVKHIQSRNSPLAFYKRRRHLTRWSGPVLEGSIFSHIEEIPCIY